VDPVTDSPDLLTGLLTALVIATALAGLAVVVCAVAVVVARLRDSAPVTNSSLDTAVTTSLDRGIAGNGRAGSEGATVPTPDQNTQAPSASVTPEVDTRRPRLPVGAEAALNAIDELRPDPRNVVVTHRDPTGEVRPYPMGNPDDHTGFDQPA
jgi:hypothetical protein